MAASSDHPETVPLPEWAGLTEPTTVLTNVVLGLFAMWLSARLGFVAAAEGWVSMLALSGAFMATAFSALFGAVAHGTDPRTAPDVRQRFWRLALYATGVIGATIVASVAFFAVRGGAVRNAILIFASVKLLAFWISVARRPEFRVAAADYGGALAVLLVAALYAWVRFDSAAAPWLVGAVALSLVGSVIQARRLGFHRHFNHNDVFHVVQMAALYIFYKGGILLVDR
jgi:hypothetical protein